MPRRPDIKIRGIRTPIPSGYVLGRTELGHGDVHLIPIGKVGGVAGVGGGGGGGGGGAGGPPSAGGGNLAAIASDTAMRALQLAQMGATNLGGGDADGGGGDVIPGPPGLAGQAGSPGVQGPIGIGFDGNDGLDGNPIPGPIGAPGTTTSAIEFIIDGGGLTILGGAKGYFEVPYNCTITRSTLLADQSGSIVVDLYVCSYADFDAGSTHPVSGDKITSSTPPTISSSTKAQDTTLSSWSTSLTAGSVIGYQVTGTPTSITRVTSSLLITKV